ncbi:TPA: hypothetical protein HA219_03760 [Candidatus Woesearchaeota archaeon]|nr:hypothetical protein [uncultured archaeon]MBS3115839.1 hypothetical protein [Candidatus Woesearchaeota archaeon]HIH39807.1 hypothetical protein [Candidatus Woesearchaeota archaeon]
MQHVAIMKKSWGLIQKILSGDKVIESRWYKSKRAPWNKIKEGEIVYFKDSGNPVTISTEVDKVLQFSDLSPSKVSRILKQYGKDDGLSADKIPNFFQLFRDKKYCMLIYLKNPEKIKPFKINKKGFGAMSAWISIDNVNKIKV